MSTFERVRSWLADSLQIPEEAITLRSTLGDLFRHPERRRSPENERDSPDFAVSPDSLDLIELTLALEEISGEPGLEVSDEDAAELESWGIDTTVQQIVELIDRNSRK